LCFSAEISALVRRAGGQEKTMEAPKANTINLIARAPQASLAFLLYAFSFVLTLTKQPILFRRIGIVAASGVVGAYTLGVLGYVLATPDMGVRCAFTSEVTYFDREFMYPRGQDPLKEGDKIKQIADEKVEYWAQVLRKLITLDSVTPGPVEVLPTDLADKDSVAARKTFVQLDSNRIVRIQYQRGKEPERSIWLRLGEPRTTTLLPTVLWFFLKIGLFGIAALVFWKRPEDRSAAVFFLLGLASFGAYIGGYHWYRIVTQPVLLILFMICAVFLPAISLHFYLVFPRPKRIVERNRWLSLAAIYSVPLVFLLLLLTGYLRIRPLILGGSANAPAVDLLFDEMLIEILIYFGVAALSFVASIGCLLHSYRTAVNDTERNQVKCILIGLLAALAPIGYTLYLAFGDKARFGGGAGTWPMFAASLCVTVAYTISITRYRLMQLDQLVSSGFVYFLISCIAGVVYYGLAFTVLFLVGSQAGDGQGPSLWQALAVSSTALVLMVAINLIRGRVQVALDRHFRREKHQLDRTLSRMSQAIEELVDPPTLARRLLHTAAESLGVTRGAVYLRQGDPQLYHLADSLGPPPQLAELVAGCPLVEALKSHGPQLTRPAGTPSDPARRQLQLLGSDVAHALTHEGQLLGLLLLGPKAHFAAYTAEDFNLLAAFAQITVLAFVSAEKHHAIETLSHDLQTKVEKIAEQQRRIMALQNQLSADVRGRPGLLPPAAATLTADTDVARLPSSPLVISSGPADLPEGMIGSSPQVRQLMHLVRKVASSSSAVLLRGESGTGKELLARAVHDCSPRAGKAFVKVNCAALSTSLLESELFGHVKGAFTNAIRDKVGRFEAANGGTLFLDEIGDISLEVQSKLLRVLQEMTFERVGSSEPIQVDVRLIAATHQDLEELIRQGRFREDLFYRLNVFPIRVPPLRERVEDIPELVAHFLRIYGTRSGAAVTSVDDDALVSLKAYPWPGNIRQLENVIERAVVIAEGPVLTVAELPVELLDRKADTHRKDAVAPEPNGVWPSPHSTALTADVPVASALPGVYFQNHRAERERREREQLVRALAAADGNKAEAARALGMARSTLVSRLKRLGLT
jgi:transcriptional regulator with GAF, ATPase, and Fis domain